MKETNLIVHDEVLGVGDHILALDALDERLDHCVPKKGVLATFSKKRISTTSRILMYSINHLIYSKLRPLTGTLARHTPGPS